MAQRRLTRLKTADHLVGQHLVSAASGDPFAFLRLASPGLIVVGQLSDAGGGHREQASAEWVGGRVRPIPNW